MLVGGELIATVALWLGYRIVAPLAKIGPGSNGWGTVLLWLLVGWWSSLVILTYAFVLKSRQRRRPFAYTFGWTLFGAALTFTISGGIFGGAAYPYPPAIALVVYSACITAIPLEESWIRVLYGAIGIGLLALGGYVYFSLMLFCC